VSTGEGAALTHPGIVAIANVLAAHWSYEPTRDFDGWLCECGATLTDGNAGDIDVAMRAHVATILAARAGAADPLRQAVEALCSQCEELPALMVKVGTSDGWCGDCLDRAANTPDAGIKALLYAAEEMSAVISDGDVAEVAAPVEGEVGRASAVERRDRLYEEPYTWLREYAADLRRVLDGNGGEAT
jgi:hypothetical protein